MSLHGHMSRNPDFHFMHFQVLLLSARNALLSRLVLRGGASPEAQSRFCQLAFGRFSSPAAVSEVGGMGMVLRGWGALISLRANSVMKPRNFNETHLCQAGCF